MKFYGGLPPDVQLYTSALFTEIKISQIIVDLLFYGTPRGDYFSIKLFCVDVFSPDDLPYCLTNRFSEKHPPLERRFCSFLCFLTETISLTKNILKLENAFDTLREKSPDMELFLVRIFLYSNWNNSVFGHFSRGESYNFWLKLFTKFLHNNKFFQEFEEYLFLNCCF